MTILEQQGAAAKQAARKLAIAGTAKKNEAREAIARALEVGAPQWLAANAEDMKEAEANGMRPAMLDRLRLTEQRVADIVAAVRQVIALPDPVGRVTKMETRPNGLQIGRKTVPLGVSMRRRSASNPAMSAFCAAAKSPSGRTAARRR